MKAVYYLFFLSIIVLSCSTDNEPSNIPGDGNAVIAEGKQVFSIDFKEIAAKISSSKKAIILDPAFALVSISDAAGNVIHTREEFTLSKVGDTYVTEEIILDSGAYNLIEFIVTDANHVIISLAPMENSALAQLTETTLPYSFTVETDETTVTSTENIVAEGFTTVDFGYGEISLDFPEATDFFSLTIDESIVITTKTLVLKSLTASNYVIDWGDGTIDEYVSTFSDTLEETELTHNYTDQNVYTVTISGPLEVIEFFKFHSNDQVNNYQSNITTVDLTKLILLKTCEIYAGKLITLDTSKNEVLETLALGYNQITNLDVSNNPQLTTAWLRYNQLTTFDVSQNSNLKFLWLTGNQISSLDLSSTTKLEKLLVRENQLFSLSVSGNLALSTIDLSDNSLSTFDISNNTNLEEINVGRNQLTTLDVSNNTNLTRIDLYHNQINTIDLATNLLLRDLYIDGNLLTTIDLSNNIELERLIIENNNFSSLDITNNPKIFNLEIGKNQFNGAQLDALISLVYDQAILNATTQGYIDFKNNPGFDQVSVGTTAKINELTDTYMWSFNNNQ